jgi:hypothetical protein
MITIQQTEWPEHLNKASPFITPIFFCKTLHARQCIFYNEILVEQPNSTLIAQRIWKSIDNYIPLKWADVAHIMQKEVLKFTLFKIAFNKHEFLMFLNFLSF